MRSTCTAPSITADSPPKPAAAATVTADQLRTVVERLTAAGHLGTAGSSA
ncbi:hypothetical protein [Streptomyces sp. NPDC059788]